MGILNSNLKHETTKSKYQKSFLIILQMFQAVNETIRKCYTPLGKYRVFIKYCVFFENFKIYSGLWPLTVFQRCVHGRPLNDR